MRASFVLRVFFMYAFSCKRGIRLKDSYAAVGVRNRATQKTPMGYDKHNRQTYKTVSPRIIVR